LGEPHTEQIGRGALTLHAHASCSTDPLEGLGELFNCQRAQCLRRTPCLVVTVRPTKLELMFYGRLQASDDIVVDIAGRCQIRAEPWPRPRESDCGAWQRRGDRLDGALRWGRSDSNCGR